MATHRICSDGVHLGPVLLLARRSASSAQDPYRSVTALWPPILLAASILVYFLVSFRTPAHPAVFEDDLYYYLTAARNIVAGRGSTFDGSRLTNGYHPLWMLVCVARLSHGFVSLPFQATLHFYQPELSALLRPVLLALTLSLLLLVFGGWGRMAPGHRALVLALLCFPALHLGVLSFASDWPLWRWYLYPFLACGLGAALVFFTRPERIFARIYPRAGILAVLLCLFAFAHVLRQDLPSRLHADSWRYAIFHSAQDLSAFAAGHPGSYAMGDRAGLVGYLLPAPLIQTEGLMMDPAFLDNIRLQRNLLGVLRGYGVRCYVATNPVPSGNCWLVREPAQGGTDVPVMPGRFCSQPVRSFLQSGFRTVVFDLTREP